VGTPYTTIFDAYFAKVKEDIYLQMDKEELTLELMQILKAALPRFLYPRVDLTINEDEEQLMYEHEPGFYEDLTNEEIQIISSLMALVWVESKLTDIEVTRQVFRDHDFQLTSQASHLRALIALKSDLKTSCRDLMHAYSKVQNRTPQFGSLAGGYGDEN
jgi:hypothetical protein